MKALTAACLKVGALILPGLACAVPPVLQDQGEWVVDVEETSRRAYAFAFDSDDGGPSGPGVSSELYLFGNMSVELGDGKRPDLMHILEHEEEVDAYPEDVDFFLGNVITLRKKGA